MTEFIYGDKDKDGERGKEKRKEKEKSVGNRMIILRELHRWKREDSHQFPSLSQRTDI